MNDRIGEKFDCVVTVFFGKFRSEFDWLNFANAGPMFDEGSTYHFKGEIITDDGYRLDYVEVIDNYQAAVNLELKR